MKNEDFRTFPANTERWKTLTPHIKTSISNFNRLLAYKPKEETDRRNKEMTSNRCNDITVSAFIHQELCMGAVGGPPWLFSRISWFLMVSVSSKAGCWFVPHRQTESDHQHVGGSKFSGRFWACWPGGVQHAWSTFSSFCGWRAPFPHVPSFGALWLVNPSVCSSSQLLIGRLESDERSVMLIVTRQKKQMNRFKRWFWDYIALTTYTTMIYCINLCFQHYVGRKRHPVKTLCPFSSAKPSAQNVSEWYLKTHHCGELS